MSIKNKLHFTNTTMLITDQAPVMIAAKHKLVATSSLVIKFMVHWMAKILIMVLWVTLLSQTVTFLFMLKTKRFHWIHEEIVIELTFWSRDFLSCDLKICGYFFDKSKQTWIISLAVDPSVCTQIGTILLLWLLEVLVPESDAVTSHRPSIFAKKGMHHVTWKVSPLVLLISLKSIAKTVTHGCISVVRSAVQIVMMVNTDSMFIKVKLSMTPTIMSAALLLRQWDTFQMVQTMVWLVDPFNMVTMMILIGTVILISELKLHALRACHNNSCLN